ncbi:RING-H2 finger protein ATL60-like [Carex rostrata]
MSDNQGSSPDLNTSAFINSNGALLGTVIFMFLVVVVIGLFYLYAKKAMRNGHLAPATDNLRVISRGLDLAVLQSLKVTIFDVKEFKNQLECAVCLSDVAEGEEVRILPKCNHGFHVKCIDLWFHSHTTCPLCRSAVGTNSVHTQEPNLESVQAHSLNAVSRDGYVTEGQVLPTNVLFYGIQDDVTTGTVPVTISSSNSSCSRKRGDTGTLVIDVPRRTMKNTVLSPISILPTSAMPLEEMKSPVSARFRSLKRLLSRGKQVVGPSASPRGGDIEQGIIHTPKTPRSFQG